MTARHLFRFSTLLLQRRTWFITLLQALLVLGSLLFAWLLRFDFTLPYRHILLAAAIVLPIIRLAVFAKFNLLHGWWRYTGVNDAWDVAKAIVSGTAVFWVAMHVLPVGAGFPRSIYILEMIMSGTILSGVRLASRVIAESVTNDEASQKKVLLIGAGFAAQMIIREFAQLQSGYRAVGCLDDNATKRGIKIQGVPVLGSVDQLKEVVEENRVDEVLITVPSATGAQMRRFVESCNRAGVRFRTVPTLRDIIAGQVTVSQFREVSVEDLLGRHPVQIDMESVRREIANRTVLVTGAAGSIGSELCRQILEYGPARLVCLDQNETGLFLLGLGLEGHKNGAQLDVRVADICDAERLRNLLAEFRPEIIFHAAAYKHVPMMESNVQEAVKNNILGLLSLLDLADECGCKNFVLISSDKAVNPTNIMGATKRICELIIASRPPNGMRCASVRFGNVLGSSGSVIPVLTQQLQNNEPLTVTHPDIKRFFMTTREAVALVLQAFVIGQDGDILVLDMGESIRIVELARTLIRLSGRSEREIEIRFTGLRDGEKLNEELFYKQEKVIPSSCEKIKRTSGPLKDWPSLCRQLEELRASMSIDGAAPVRAKVKEIVPEYSFPIDHPKQPVAIPRTGAHLRAVAGHH
jgi:FlaA1/EpsC-like NDP-sugar epimerase